MSEKEAWLYLRDAWSKYDDEDWRRRVSPLLNFGLCYAITYLWRRKDISQDTQHNMQDRLREQERIRDNKPAAVSEPTDVYYWTCDSAGAKERAAFCERMAELCPST